MLKKYVLLAMAFGLSVGMVLAESEEKMSSDQVTQDQYSVIVCPDCPVKLPTISFEFEIEAKVTRCDLLLLFPVDFTVSNLTTVLDDKTSYFCLFTMPGGVVIEFTISSKDAPVDIFAAEKTQDLVHFAIETLRSNVFKKLSSRENKQLTDEELSSIEQEVKRYAQETCDKLAKEYRVLFDYLPVIDSPAYQEDKKSVQN